MMRKKGATKPVKSVNQPMMSKNRQLMRAEEDKGSNGEKERIKSKTDDDYSDIRNTKEQTQGERVSKRVREADGVRVYFREEKKFCC